MYFATLNVKLLVLFAIFIILPETKGAVRVRCGYVCDSSEWVVQQNTGICYLFSESTLQWYNAQRVCKDLGSNLVTIDSNNTQAYIMLTMRKYHARGAWGKRWFGLNDWEREGTLKWADNSTVSFNLHQGQPNAIQNREGYDCVSIESQFGTWSFDMCDALYKYICEKPALFPIETCEKNCVNSG